MSSIFAAWRLSEDMICDLNMDILRDFGTCFWKEHKYSFGAHDGTKIGSTFKLTSSDIISIWKGDSPEAKKRESEKMQWFKVVSPSNPPKSAPSDFLICSEFVVSRSKFPHSHQSKLLEPGSIDIKSSTKGAVGIVRFGFGLSEHIQTVYRMG
jgi:hypothetical protein